MAHSPVRSVAPHPIQIKLLELDLEGQCGCVDLAQLLVDFFVSEETKNYLCTPAPLVFPFKDWDARVVKDSHFPQLLDVLFKPHRVQTTVCVQPCERLQLSTVGDYEVVVPLVSGEVRFVFLL